MVESKLKVTLLAEARGIAKKVAVATAAIRKTLGKRESIGASLRGGGNIGRTKPGRERCRYRAPAAGLSHVKFVTVNSRPVNGRKGLKVAYNLCRARRMCQLLVLGSAPAGLIYRFPAA